VTISSTKSQLKRALDIRIKKCKLCPGLNIPKITENAPGYGNLDSPVMMIGQSLCTDCMETQIPFTGGSGRILDRVFKRLKIKKEDVFITNLLHCHPISNRPSKPHEIANCKPFLIHEINIVKPKVVIAFGADVRKHVILKHRFVNYCYHPAYVWRQGGLHSKTTDAYVEYLANFLKRYI